MADGKVATLADFPESSPANKIRNIITRSENRLRQKHSWLKYQNEIGLAIWLVSLSVQIVSSVAWYYGKLSNFWMIILNALATSLLHELEHDIIHDLYFKDSFLVQTILFTGIWFAKLGISPWWRKWAHLKHHRDSGQESDVEERLIGLGTPLFSIQRLLITFFPVIGGWTLAIPLIRVLGFMWVPILLFGGTLLVQFGTFCQIVMIVNYFSPATTAAYFSATTLHKLYVITMTLQVPNLLRQACLQFVSVSCHYYGDIPTGDPFYQTQILDHPVFYPFQLFCFNFGATHAIHHFIAKQPFYLRQMLAPDVLEPLFKLGVRHNDLGALLRNNAFNPTK